MPRTIAIGDIHGCSLALERVLEALCPVASDTIVTLGDYVDRGLDSRGVIEQLIALAEHSRLMPLLGNHDAMLLGARVSPENARLWLECGGGVTLDSYGVSQSIQIPDRAIRFLERCLRYCDFERHFFVHANYLPERPLDEQDETTLCWLSLRDYVPGPHLSGKVAIVGHTPQREILNLGHLISIDTGCVYGGWLTALDVESGRVWQANESGVVREDQLQLTLPHSPRRPSG